MRIQPAQGTAAPANQLNFQQGADAVFKNLQKQIANAQKALQELSANKDISAEEKMQKRQELQQQITDLNNQLRQHQIELRRERQQAAKEGEAARQEKKAGLPSHGVPKASMEAIVSADTAMKQAKAYGSTATRLKGEASVLQGEIKLDKDRGIDVGQKEGSLAKLEDRIEAATNSQLAVLEEANQGLQEAGSKEQEEKAEEKTDSAGAKSTHGNGETEGTGKQRETEKMEPANGTMETEKAESTSRETANIGQEKSGREQAKTGKEQQDGQFVDIRL